MGETVPDQDDPLVSVVMPVYNGAGTLATAVDSVLNQSQDNLELLIVDDASTDQTPEVARKLADQDRRIRVFRHSANQGQSAARNYALSAARGTWVAPVDADDEITEHRFRDLCGGAQAENADFIADGVCFAGPRRPGTPAELSASRTMGGGLTTLTVEALIRSDIPLNGLCSFGYLKPLMRRRFLEHWGLRYDEELRFAEDLNLYVRALLCGARFVLHPQSYYIYNQTPVSASRNSDTLPGVADHALVNSERMRELARQRQLYELEPLLEEHRQRWSTVLWFNRLKTALRDGRLSEAVQLSLDCPSGPRGVIRFARDRVRVKRGHEHASGA